MEIRLEWAFAPVFAFLFLLGSCSQEKGKFNESTRILRDKFGHEARIKPGPVKVMGLSPAITEMLFALLPDSCIAAVTPHCNYPETRIKGKHVISVMPLDFESLIKINPSLLLTEEGITSMDDFHRMQELSLPVLMFSYRKISDITDAMDSIRIWTNAGKDALIICKDLRLRLNKMQKQASKKPEKERKRLLALTWTDPVFAYGYDTWMSEKMWLAGGKNALGKKFEKPYPQLEREQILALDPDVIFGGSFEKMDSSFFRMYPELKKLKAYQSKSIFELNDDLASRPGPRFAEGIKEISDYINR